MNYNASASWRFPASWYAFTLLLLSLPSFAWAGPTTTQALIRVDQFGYLPDMTKVAVISNPQTGFNSADSYIPNATLELRDWDTDGIVFSGPATAWNAGATHAQSGDQAWWFDFSTVVTPGDYYVYDPVADVGSYRFTIGDDVYKAIMVEAVRTFFYQRSGFAKNTPFVPAAWSDGASHLGAEQDTDCRLVTDPTNTALSKDLSGGWYDAGDYNKYVNFTYTTLHDLLGAYDINPAIWTDDFNIPESGNGVPDLLDEIKWELDWLLKMQQADGSCLSKVSVIDFAAASPPSADTAPRRYGPATASSTRTICSIFAHASMVYRTVGTAAMTEYADTLQARAIRAWNWIDANPATSNYNNAGFQSASPEISAYQQDAVLLGAAGYLFAATGNATYRSYFDANYASMQPLQWTYWYAFESSYQDAMLYYAALPNATPAVATAIQNNCIASTGTNHAQMLPAYLNQTDPYRASIQDNDYVWGSNSVKAHSGIILANMLQYNLDAANQANYRDAAAGFVHYLHGTNPLGMVMLTNMSASGAESSANEMYHGWFGHGTDFDNAQTSLYGPAPGYVTGGPNPNYTPAMGYFSPPQGQPAQKSYLDWNTSWPENSWEVTEPAIYYQAGYIKLLSQFTRNSSNPLAVEYDYFTASPNEKGVQLSWKTLTQEGTDRFIIERSQDGLQFENIATQNALPTGLAYEYLDELPPVGRLWYRLTEIELSGAQNRSEIREVNFQIYPKFEFWPNPAADVLNIRFYHQEINEYR
ncbi:MAG: glycoside hydrolase family 9 protein, partial [Bacteroidota bacterium]